jgi:hypothetical protein
MFGPEWKPRARARCWRQDKSKATSRCFSNRVQCRRRDPASAAPFAIDPDPPTNIIDRVHYPFVDTIILSVAQIRHGGIGAEEFGHLGGVRVAPMVAIEAPNEQPHP